MSGSKDRGVQFWDPVTGNAQMMLQGHKNSGEFDSIWAYGGSLSNCSLRLVISVAPSPTGNLFATGSGDMRARIWRWVFPYFPCVSDHKLTVFLTFLDTRRTLDDERVDPLGALWCFCFALLWFWAVEFVFYLFFPLLYTLSCIREFPFNSKIAIYYIVLCVVCVIVCGRRRKRGHTDILERAELPTNTIPARLNHHRASEILQRLEIFWIIRLLGTESTESMGSPP